MTDPKHLVQTLTSHGLRSRTGMLSLDAGDYGRESEIAAQLGIELLDYPARMLAQATKGSAFLNISLASILEDADAIGNAATGELCVLVAQFDVAVAYLNVNERNSLWQRLFTDFPYRTRRLLFCVPAHQEGAFIIPDLDIRRMWRESKRCAHWQWNLEA